MTFLCNLLLSLDLLNSAPDGGEEGGVVAVESLSRSGASKRVVGVAGVMVGASEVDWAGRESGLKNDNIDPPFFSGIVGACFEGSGSDGTGGSSVDFGTLFS